MKNEVREWKFIKTDFYRGKRVLVTGDTGFKGTWLCRILIDLGAEVTGYALPGGGQPGGSQPGDTEPGESGFGGTGGSTFEATSWNFYERSGLKEEMRHVEGDIRNLQHLQRITREANPQVVFHLAAQPLVLQGYANPVETYSTNVLGTVHILESLRLVNQVQSFVNVTTDKVYKNREWEWGYRENEELFGEDPYSNSKSCSELVTSCYRESFFKDTQVAISSVRAGNVIGGGDFACHRILPDCMRGVLAGKKIQVRNPYSVRPYQHVLEPLFAYLELGAAQYSQKQLEGAYNVGPRLEDCRTTEEIVASFCKYYGNAEWEILSRNNSPKEAGYLKLDSTKIQQLLSWIPRWTPEEAVEQTVVWWKGYFAKGQIKELMQNQILAYKSAKGEFENGI